LRFGQRSAILPFAIIKITGLGPERKNRHE
jgi:hypothetical protein